MKNIQKTLAASFLLLGATAFLVSCAGQGKSGGSAPGSAAPQTGAGGHGPGKGPGMEKAPPMLEGCRMRVEPPQARVGQSYVVYWNSSSMSAALFAPESEGLEVPAAGTRSFQQQKMGNYTYSVGLKGAKGGAEGGCSVTVRVGEPPKYGKSKLVVEKKEKREAGTQVFFFVSVDPGAKKCEESGPYSIGFGDGAYANVMPPRGDKQQGLCKLQVMGSYSNTAGVYTPTFYRGTATDAASGKAQPLAETQLTFDMPKAPNE